MKPLKIIFLFSDSSDYLNISLLHGLKSLENVELYTDNVLLKRQIKTLQTQVEKGKELISKLQKQIKK